MSGVGGRARHRKLAVAPLRQVQMHYKNGISECLIGACVHVCVELRSRTLAAGNILADTRHVYGTRCGSLQTVVIGSAVLAGPTWIYYAL